MLWHDALGVRVGRLLPLLLDACRYDEDEVEGLLELDDARRPLEERHIAPWFVQGRRRGAAVGGDGEGGGETVAGTGWSLRKGAAAALDAVSGAFGNPLLEALMPQLRARLADGRWETREAAMLAVGAAAEGTINVSIPKSISKDFMKSIPCFVFFQNVYLM